MYASARPSRVVVTLLLFVAIGVAPASAQGTGSAPSQPLEHPVPSLGGIFAETLRDFTHLPTKANVVWLAGGGAVAGALAPWDQEISNAMSGSSGADSFFASGNVMGNAAIPIGAGFVIYDIGRAGDHSRAALFGSDLVRAQFVSGVITQTLKFTVRRERPDGSNQSSFPSGHASTMFATAGIVLHHFGWKWGAPVYAGAVYVGLSRIQTRKHYPGDVAFGAAIGIVSSRTVTLGSGRAKTTITPMLGPGVAGVAVRIGSLSRFTTAVAQGFTPRLTRGVLSASKGSPAPGSPKGLRYTL